MSESTDRIQRVNNFEFSKEQIEIVDSKTSMVIAACPGSGKTEVLASLAARKVWDREVQIAKKLLITTFSREAGKNIKLRANGLLERLGSSQRVDVNTLHSFFLSSLRKLRYNGTVISDSTRNLLISNAIKTEIKNPDEELQGKLATLFSYQINNMMNDYKLFKSSAYNIDLPFHVYTNIRNKFTEYKNNSNEIDYDDIQLLFYNYISGNEDYRKYCAGFYTHYFIDEGQDVNKIQYRIMKLIIGDPDKIEDRLVIVGDTDQCIYEWRGANPRIMLNIRADYPLDKKVLSTNYRSSEIIVSSSQKLIARNKDRYDITAKHSKEDAGYIKVHVENGDSLYAQSEKAMQIIIEHLHEQEMLNRESPENSKGRKGDIAVLCRNNAHGLLLQMLLKMKGINFKYNSKMDITKSEVYKDIHRILMLAKTPSGLNKKNVSNTLWKFIKFFGAAKARTIVSLMEEDGLNFLDAIQKYRHWLNEDREMLFEGEMAQLYNIDEFISALTHSDEIVRFNKLIGLYVETTADFLYKGSDKKRLLWGLIELTNGMLKKHKNITLVLDDISTLDMEQSLWEDDGTEAQVTLSTLHEAKGMEWDRVILIACDISSSPSVERMNQMKQDKISTEEIERYIEEERRLNYVGQTRARYYLEILAGRHVISPFIIESLYDTVTNEKGEVTGGLNNRNIITDSNEYEKVCREFYIYTSMKNGVYTAENK